MQSDAKLVFKSVRKVSYDVVLALVCQIVL